MGSHSRKSNSESHSPGLSGSSIVGISDSSTVTVQEFDCKNEPLDKTATDDLPGACRPKKRRHASIRGNICSTSHNLHGLDKFDDDENPVGCGILLDKKEESFVEASEVSREKRLRKPTLRFIEEFSDKKSKYFKAKETVSVITTTKGNRVKVRSHGKLDHMKPGALSSVAEEEFCGTEIQAVSEFRSLRGRPKKHVSTLVGSHSTLLYTLKLLNKVDFVFFFARVSNVWQLGETFTHSPPQKMKGEWHD